MIGLLFIWHKFPSLTRSGNNTCHINIYRQKAANLLVLSASLNTPDSVWLDGLGLFIVKLTWLICLCAPFIHHSETIEPLLLGRGSGGGDFWIHDESAFPGVWVHEEPHDLLPPPGHGACERFNGEYLAPGGESTMDWVAATPPHRLIVTPHTAPLGHRLIVTPHTAPLAYSNTPNSSNGL